MSSYNRGGFIILLVSVFLSFSSFMYVIYFSPPIDLGELENQQAGGGVSQSGIDLSQITEYWLSSEGLVKHGESIYQIRCASCHGRTGAGDGIAARGLNPPPRSFIDGQWKKGGDSITLYQTLLQGIEGSSMTSFSYLPKLDRWALVHYIRSITNNKIEDDSKEVEEFAKNTE